MFSLFKKTPKEPKEQHNAQYVPGTKIPYRADLVDELVTEHDTLLLAIKQIAQAHARMDHKVIYRLLNKLKSDLNSHMIKDNTYLYLYLKHIAQDDASRSEKVAELHQKMTEIGRFASRFVRKWTEGKNVAYDHLFLEELNAVEKVLRKRIEKEESVIHPFYSRLGAGLPD